MAEVSAWTRYWDTSREKGVSSTIGIPNPVVGIEGLAIILVNLTIEGREVLAVLAQTNGALEGTIVRGVENRLLILGSTLYHYITEGLVPLLTSIGSHLSQIKGTTLLASQILLCLFFTNQRDTIAEANLLGSGRETEGSTDIASFGILFLRNLSLMQNAHLLGLHIKFARKIDIHSSAQALTGSNLLLVCLHKSTLAIEQNGGRLRGVLESNLVDSTLMADSQMSIYAVIGNLNLIVVRCNSLLIPIGADDRLQLTALCNTQAKSAALAMVRNHHWQTVQHLVRVLPTCGIDTHQAVGQLDSWETRHQHVADTANVRIHIINGLRRSSTCRQRAKEKE